MLDVEQVTFVMDGDRLRILHFALLGATIPGAGGRVKWNLGMGVNVCVVPSDASTVASVETRPVTPNRYRAKTPGVTSQLLTIHGAYTRSRR